MARRPQGYSSSALGRILQIWISLYPSMFSTLRPRQNGRHFADDTFKRIFMNENVRVSINISLKFVPKGLINNIPALVQILACADQATSHYLNQWWSIYWRIYASLGLNELSDHNHFNVLDEIGYLIPDFNGAAVREWIIEFIRTLLCTWLLFCARIKVNPCL